jgi:hypothetical protein
MAKIDIPNIVSGYASTTALNNAFNSIETELNNKVLYRNNPNGEPNQMENNLDMNGFNILNLNSLEVGGIDVGAIATQVDADATAAAASALAASNSASAAAISAASAEEDAEFLQDFGWEGSWQTGVLYKVSNIVREAGVAYICLEEHTSGTFSTDLIANKWEVFAEKGAAGTGTGDMLAANNLSDVSDVPTARANLGLGVLSTQGDGDKGDITVSSSGTSWIIDDDTVTFAKMQNINSDRLLGRSTTSTGNIEELTLGEGLTLTSGVLSSSAKPLTSDTVKASTSGTTVSFTGIPNWVKHIVVMFRGVSTNGSSNIQIQLGDSGGFETTGYSSSAISGVNSGSSTTGALVTWSNASGRAYHGVIDIYNITGNIWVFKSILGEPSSTIPSSSGSSKELSDVLTQIRVTTVNGTDSFDAGSINIMYE